MATIKYEYHIFEFNRLPLARLDQKEFQAIRKDFENFLGNFLEEKEAEFRKLKNPHRFNFKLFLLLLGSGLILGFTGYYLEKQGHENIGITLDLLALAVGFAIVMQPVQWIMSFLKSSDFGTYEKRAREYYSFHRSQAVAANHYENYLQMLAARNISDFTVFCREQM